MAVKSRKPWVMINMAMSIDGKASSKRREPTTFTSREDKRFLVELRSRCDALIVGAGTVRIDRATLSIPDPKLREVRVKRGQREYPLRVLISKRLTLDPDHPVFRKNVAPLLIVTTELSDKKRREVFAKKGHLMICGKRELDVRKLVSILHQDYRANVILSEGGPTLNDAFFRARVVNELFLTICPRIVGGQDAPTIVEGEGFPRLKDAVKGRLVSCRKGQEEWFLRYQFA
jgi:2,5-diamino-6-(ribosylamino)-4(3H)-pyrimidinone 5'-phosphate reductase